MLGHPLATWPRGPVPDDAQKFLLLPNSTLFLTTNSPRRIPLTKETTYRSATKHHNGRHTSSSLPIRRRWLTSPVPTQGPNRLCKCCARAITASKKLWQPRPPGEEPDWTGEKFFHSNDTKEMLENSVIGAGCHLCTQVRLENNTASAGDEHRVMIECSRSTALEGDGGDIPVVSFSATSCAEWDDSWASLPDSVKDEEPQGDPETIPLMTFKLERTDGSGGGPKSLLPQRLPDGSMFVLPCSTDSAEAYGLVRHWLNECLDNHPECKGSSSSFQRLPTRLVDVGGLGENGQKKPL